MWNTEIYVQHVAIEGLATARGIQGSMADACIELLKHEGIHPVMKWVDDFVFFRSPILIGGSTSNPPSYTYNLQSIQSFTSPLGIPWHPLSRKGQDFKDHFTYVGFQWDISARTVSISEEKKARVAVKLAEFLKRTPCKVKRHEVASLHGSLQHLTFVYRAGRHCLPAISLFLSKFLNDFVSHHVPHAVFTQLSWWKDALSKPPMHRSLTPLPLVDLDIWTNASSSWGIGIYIKSHWAAWRLAANWAQSGRDIRWAEAIALELVVLWLAETGQHDVVIKVHCDNSNVINAFWKGRSRNEPRNACIHRILVILATSNLALYPVYVPSSENKADSLSRGVLGDPMLRIPSPFPLPSALSPFLFQV